MPLKLALAVRGTVAGHRLGAREGGGVQQPDGMSHRGYPPPPSNASCRGRGDAHSACHELLLCLFSDEAKSTRAALTQRLFVASALRARSRL